jgi:hypothetical protein
MLFIMTAEDTVARFAGNKNPEHTHMHKPKIVKNDFIYILYEILVSLLKSFSHFLAVVFGVQYVVAVPDPEAEGRRIPHFLNVNSPVPTPIPLCVLVDAVEGWSV